MQVSRNACVAFFLSPINSRLFFPNWENIFLQLGKLTELFPRESYYCLN